MIEETQKKKVSRQRLWQLKMIAMGNCGKCGKPRGEDGTKNNCRPCAKKNSDMVLRYYHRKNKRKSLSTSC